MLLKRMKKIFKVSTVFTLAAILFFSIAHAGSLWKEGTSSSPYSTQKAYKIGDIVTVLILESTSALQKAGTKTDVRDDLGVSFSHTIERLYPSIQPSTVIKGGVRNEYKGLGETARSSDVKATISARVIDILPNGNLEIRGIHKLEVNQEKQEIEITGIIRAKDVSMANTVYSYQVADANISVKGEGAVGEAEEPGWITRVLNWIF